jgi:hypothetical protein
MICTHHVTEIERSAVCPLCQLEKIKRLRAALNGAMQMLDSHKLGLAREIMDRALDELKEA